LSTSENGFDAALAASCIGLPASVSVSSTAFNTDATVASAFSAAANAALYTSPVSP
jgi:hypothetical protein